MSAVRHIRVDTDDDGVRLDRWFKQRFPKISHSRLQKLLRTGQVRVEGGRAKAGTRLAGGQMVRVPPLDDAAGGSPKPPRRKRAADMRGSAELVERVLHCDDHLIVIDKPPGLAVQGGTGTPRHIDGMLDALRFGAAERPRLVHRLDKDTSGLLLLARSARTARALADSFRSRQTRKLYWAFVVGVPKPASGMIDRALDKQAGSGREKMTTAGKSAKRAQTLYRVLDNCGRQAAWLPLEPLTGRTHQLRVHASEGLGTPILGDGKYGGREAFLDGEGIAKKLHLHARGLWIPHPAGGILRIMAPLPPHMEATRKALGMVARGDFDEMSALPKVDD